MQSVLSYFTYFSWGILTLEIAYFLLCIVSQFKRLNAVVIVSCLIHLGVLFLINRFFLSSLHSPFSILETKPYELSVIGFAIFSLMGISIIGTDEKDLLAKKKVALKLPFMGIFIGYFILGGDIRFNFFFLGLTLIVNFYFLYRTRERFRLYFRTFLFFLVSLIGLFSYEIPLIGLFLGFAFSFLSILYLQQFLNLILVKIYIRESIV